MMEHSRVWTRSDVGRYQREFEDELKKTTQCWVPEHKGSHMGCQTVEYSGITLGGLGFGMGRKG